MKKEKGKNDSFEGDWSMRSGLRKRLGFRVGDDVFSGIRFRDRNLHRGKNGGRREIFFPPIIREGERRSRVRNFRVITRRLFPFVADNKKTLASTRFLENSVEKNACPFSIVNR